MKRRHHAVLLGVFVTISLSAILALAASGGIKVSDTSVICGDAHKESNNLTGKSKATVWLNAPGSTASRLLDRGYIISCKSGATSNCHNSPCCSIDLDHCDSSDPNYYSADFNLLNTSPDRCTFTLYTDDTCSSTISSDSWRQ